MSTQPDRFAEEQYTEPSQRLRQEIALRAARLIAEDGLDYAGAKRRAAREMRGNRRQVADVMPDNAMVEAEVRLYQELFQSDSQPARLAELRATALEMMEFLAVFTPVLVGAVANGTAGEHSDIHLQLFCDSAKEVEMTLLNHGVDFDVDEARQGGARHAQGAEEIIRFLWRGRNRQSEGIHLNVYTGDRMRPPASERKQDRLSLAAVRQLLNSEEPS